MKNEDLRSRYDAVYRSGEEQFFSKFQGGRNISAAPFEVLNELQWEGQRVLEIGCGTGEVAHEIAVRGGNVLAVDYSEEAIRIARQRHNHPRLDFECKGADEIQGVFDIVLSMGTLEHLANPKGALQRFMDLVVPGGTILITCPNFTNLRGYILLTLYHLFQAPISLTDLHFLSPVDMERWARQLGLTLTWRTCDFRRGHGDLMLDDLAKRLPNVLRDAGLPAQGIPALLRWLEEIAHLDNYARHSGATAIYRFTKP